MEHKVTLGIEAPSKSQAEDVAMDLVSIRNSLKNDADLKELAKILREKPGIIQTAKKFLG